MDNDIQYLDPDEEFEMMYADELEMMDDIMSEQNQHPKKALKFDNLPTNMPSSLKNQSICFEELPSTSSGIYHLEDETFCLDDQPGTSGLNLNKSMSKVDTQRESSGLNLNNSVSKVDSQSESSGLKISGTKLNGDFSPKSPPLMDLEESFNNVSNSKIVVSQNNRDNNKRTAEDLFGDIDDLDFCDDLDFLTQNKKKIRMEQNQEDKDKLTIARILEERRKRASNITLNGYSVHETNLINNMKSEVSLVRRVPKWNFMTLRNGKGEKFYTKLHSDEALHSKITSISEQCKTTRLLSIPFEDILNDANAIIAKKLEAEINPQAVETPQSGMNLTDLWVEKYKPMSYIDLLSDEGTNRILLQWIKLWDKVVFGKEKKVKKRENKYKSDNKFIRRGFVLDEELDETGCPKHKLVLLCGPPGLGKTTLAHIVAKHAGYNVVELNASDDRSPEIFRHQLEAATQMRAVIGKSPKPNCLVIDEIDGAPSASIDVLIKFARGESKKISKKKTTKSSVSLKRPIICICNDVYVPALRPLRQMALVLQFPPMSIRSLSQRLVEIARKEKISTDTGAMMALCEKASNDIRTCLSTIYCLKDEPIRISTIAKTNVGNKDMQKGLFTVWQEIFQIQSHKMTTTQEMKKDGKTETELILTKRLCSILRTVQGNGDYDRLAQGVYENYLNVKLKNYSISNISKSLQWFCFFDQLKTSIATAQNYTLMKYMPYCFVMWHFMFSNYLKPKLAYPSMMYELTTRRSKYSQIVEEVMKGMEPKIRAYSHREQLLLDNLPYFSTLLNPNIRPVSSQLFSNSEKIILRQLVNTMIDYNLNFVQERTPEGNYEFIIDPNVDELITFPNLSKPKSLTYSLKMIISKEIEQEKLKRLEEAISKHNANNENQLNTPTNHHPSIEKEVISKPVESLSQGNEVEKKQNHLQKLTPKAIKKCTAATHKRDFFGRIVEKSATEISQAAKVDEIVKSDVWYHFKEGFSNAVRRFVYIKDLLQN